MAKTRWARALALAHSCNVPSTTLSERACPAFMPACLVPVLFAGFAFLSRPLCLTCFPARAFWIFPGALFEAKRVAASRNPRGYTTTAPCRRGSGRQRCCWVRNIEASEARRHGVKQACPLIQLLGITLNRIALWLSLSFDDLCERYDSKATKDINKWMEFACTYSSSDMNKSLIKAPFMYFI